MTQTVTALQNWLDALKAALSEVSKTILNQEEGSFNPRQNDLPWNNTIGAYIPIISRDYSLQLGLVSTEDGCNTLARALLKRSPDELLCAEDMADAIREVVNIICGMSKAKIEGDVSNSTLGLPIFIEGHIRLTKEQDVCSEMVMFGNVKCYLIVLRQK
ncbi:chemotaxis protein CheX [bacterium]|nr:chemotaxis protein CheX [bacterium]